MKDLEYYDYKLITEFDWISFLIIALFPSCLLIPISFMFIVSYSNGFATLNELKGMLLVASVGYGIFALVGYSFARGCPKCVKTVEQVENLPTFGQKKKVLK